MAWVLAVGMATAAPVPRAGHTAPNRYLAMVVTWLAGAFKPTLTVPALACCAVFMLGLAAGRVLSLVLDGVPHWLLLVYLVLELVLGVIAAHLLRQHGTEGGAF